MGLMITTNCLLMYMVLAPHDRTSLTQKRRQRHTPQMSMLLIILALWFSVTSVIYISGACYCARLLLENMLNWTKCGRHILQMWCYNRWLDSAWYPQSVGLHSHNCSDLIKKIYYSAYKDDLIWIHCDTFWSSKQPYLTSQPNTFYPYCADCSSIERMKTANDFWSQLAFVLLY